MAKNDLAEYKKKYQAVRHHAWAGSVLLAVLFAIRILIELSDTHVTNLDVAILVLGVVIICYTLIALFLTYKYRSGLYSEDNTLQIISSADELEKQNLKIEKKKAKIEAKTAKKSNKK